MIIELLATLVIHTQKIKEIDVGSNNNLANISTGSDYFILGDSQYQAEQKERELANEVSRRNRQVIAREKATRTGGTSSYQANPYIYGYCTWYVAKEKGITTNWGDAKKWPVNSSTPTKGAIIVTYENRWFGHVGIVEEVEGYNIEISEMNYAGWNRVSTRVVDYRTLPLKGFLVI